MTAKLPPLVAEFDTAKVIENQDARREAIFGLICKAIAGPDPETIISLMQSRLARAIPLDVFKSMVKDAKSKARKRAAAQHAASVGNHAIRIATQREWTYSTGRENCCKFCGSHDAGVYVDGEFMAGLPDVRARAIQGHDRRAERHFIIARDSQA